jgi:hypothetical protein
MIWEVSSASTYDLHGISLPKELDRYDHASDPQAQSLNGERQFDKTKISLNVLRKDLTMLSGIPVGRQKDSSNVHMRL